MPASHGHALTFPTAASSGVEQMVGHTTGLTIARRSFLQCAEVPLPELKERGEIMFSGATGAAVGSGRGVATTALI